MRKSRPYPQGRVLRAPAAVGRVTSSGLTGRSRVPTLRSNGRNITIVHTERFASVVTTTTNLEVHSYSLNPGMAAMFPWLSDVANRFDKYKFRNVHFNYVPSSPALSGIVSMAFDFDPNDDPPATMEDANTYHDYVTTSIWAAANLKLDLVNGDRLPQKDTRPGLPGADLDLNMYDVGNLHVLTQGAAAATIGYIEVSYTVELFIHQIQSGIGGSSYAATGLDATHLVGSDMVYNPQSFLPVVVSSTSTFTYTQPFEGLISVSVGGTGLGNDITIPGAAVLARTVNAATTDVVATFHARRNTGDTMIPTITATTVTDIWYFFARAGYNALTPL